MGIIYFIKNTTFLRFYLLLFKYNVILKEIMLLKHQKCYFF